MTYKLELFLVLQKKKKKKNLCFIFFYFFMIYLYWTSLFYTKLTHLVQKLKNLD